MNLVLFEKNPPHVGQASCLSPVWVRQCSLIFTAVFAKKEQPEKYRWVRILILAGCLEHFENIDKVRVLDWNICSILSICNNKQKNNSNGLSRTMQKVQENKRYKHYSREEHVYLLGSNRGSA